MTLINVADASTMILQSLYFKFFKNWIYLHMLQLFFSIVMIMCISRIPESPKYLYAKGQFNKTRDVLRHIASTNKPPGVS